MSENKKPVSQYYISILNGNQVVFEGSSSVFKNTYYPQIDCSDEDVLNSAYSWAIENHWSFESFHCH